VEAQSEQNFVMATYLVVEQVEQPGNALSERSTAPLVNAEEGESEIGVCSV